MITVAEGPSAAGRSRHVSTYRPGKFVNEQPGHTRKGNHLNLDYPAGLAYHLMGFDIPVFTPIFVMIRIAGWTAHITEQLAHNALIRPLASYAGPEQRTVPAAG